MKKIIVLGSSNTDMVIISDRLPCAGETILGKSFFMNPGGKGGNQAVAAARMNGNVTFISKIGNDVFGQQSLELYEKEKINTRYIFIDKNTPSGIALIIVDSKGENTIAVASGANEKLIPEDILTVKSVIESGEILLMQLETPLETIEFAAEIAKKKGIKVILNPAPAKQLPNSLFKNLDIITPNRTEAEILSGIKVIDLQSAKRAAEEIAKKGVNTVIITLGSSGALIWENEIHHFVEAEKVEAIDTTAAGDTFNGVLSVVLSEGKSTIEAVEFASRAAAIAVTRMGAQSSIPYRNELELINH